LKRQHRGCQRAPCERVRSSPRPSPCRSPHGALGAAELGSDLVKPPAVVAVAALVVRRLRSRVRSPGARGGAGTPPRGRYQVGCRCRLEQVEARIKQIEAELARHERLNDELARLRDALGRLEGAARSQVSRGRRGRRTAARPEESDRPARAPRRTSASGRASGGQNKAKVLEALTRGPMTASEISEVTGVGTGTASTLLTKLAKTGEVTKADRGYKLPD
jgi:hypothetical protein